MTKEDLVVMMNIMDADGSGEVERNEFEEFYRRMYPKMSDPEFDSLWKVIDKNGDNNLSFDELCEHFGVDLAEANDARIEQLSMTDEKILEALQLQAVLDEEMKKREEAEKTRKKTAAARRRTSGAMREGVKLVKLSDTSVEAELLQECELGNMRRVNELLSENTNVRIQDEKGEMVVHKLAKVGGNEEIKKVFEMMGTDTESILSDVNSPDKQGWSPLFHACVYLAAEHKKKPDDGVPLGMLNTLLKAGCDLEHQSNQGWNVLHLCAHNDAKAIMELIVSRFKATTQNNKRALEEFVNRADVDGRAPLHIASFRMAAEGVKYLLENYADPDASDTNNNTPEGLAERAGRRKSRELITDFKETKKAYKEGRIRTMSREIPEIP